VSERLLVPIALPSWLAASLRKAKRTLVPPAPVVKNIDGERHVEWSFLGSVMPDGPGEAIDFGCENGYMSLLAAEKGFHVLAVDLEQQNFAFQHPKINFQLGDFLKLDLPENHFDLIVNCSSVEHVGVAGRYGIAVQQDEGDLEALRKFARVLKPSGLLIMTAPCGMDAVMAPWCRVYGPERLPRLLSPLRLEKERFWVKDEENRWTEVGRETALKFQPRHDPANPHGCSYALGGFVLRKAISPNGASAKS
jgi:SAM-dependent methyltransferase